MILIADAGSTEIKWAFIDKASGTRLFFATSGYNPNYHDGSTLKEDLESMKNTFPSIPQSIFYYGTGCRPEASQQRVKKILADVFQTANVSVESDLLGAAHSLFGQKAGIVSILGTGTNAGHYDGKELQYSVSLGYLIDDFGSGYDIARNVLLAIKNRSLSDRIIEKLLQNMGTDLWGYMERAYQSSVPNSEIARITKMIVEFKGEQAIDKIVRHCFDNFFDQTIRPMGYGHDLDIRICGSVGLLLSGYPHECLQKAWISSDPIYKECP